MKVTINTNLCIGCGMCEGLSNGAINASSGKTVVNPSADVKNVDVQEAIKLAASACPVQAIIVEE